MSARCCLASITFVLAVACAGTSAHPSVMSTAVGPCWLVWHVADGSFVTDEVCEVEGEARVRATRPGVELAVDGRVVRVEVVDVELPALRCTDSGDDFERDGDRVVHGQRLELVEHDRHVVLLEAPNDFGAVELDDHIELIGSVGPYLAVRRFTHSADACAVHAYETTEVTWFDVRTGVRVDLPVAGAAERADATTAIVELVRAGALSEHLATFREEEVVDPDVSLEESFVDDSVSIALVGPGPRYIDGVLHFAFTVLAAVYDNADALEASVPTSAPEVFAEYLEAPPLVALFVEPRRSSGPCGWTPR